MKVVKWSVVAVALSLFACGGHENTLTGPPESVMSAAASASASNGSHGAAGRSRSAPSTPQIEAEGLVKSVSATSLTITDSRRGDMTFTLTPATIIRKGQQTVNATDLASGDRVHVRATKSGDTLTAQLVIVQNAEEENEPSEFEGIVKAISADSLTLSTPGGDIVLTLNAKTEFVPAPPVAGNRVHVRADHVSSGLVALVVMVQGPEEHETIEVNGIVKTISATAMTVTTPAKGDVTLKIDAQTTFHPAPPSVGSRVEVRATMKGGVLVATDVRVEGKH